MSTHTTAGVCLFLLLSNMAAAQSFELGVKGGMTVAAVTGPAQEFESVVEETGTDLGVAIGGSFAYVFTERLALQPEVLFVQKTHALRLSSDDPLGLFTFDERFAVSLNYLEVPVLARVAIGGRGLQLLAGPSINFSLDRNASVDLLDIGLVVGGGFYGRLITLEGRYEEGVTGSTSGPNEDQGVRNRAFLLLFGVLRR